MNGDPATLQFITPDGRKLYLPGGRKAGCFRAVLKESGAPVYVAEGFATACSIAEALTEPANVVAAFDADNLLLVARALRERLGPTRRIVICADDDYRTAGNPGLSKATEAARAVGALLAVPTFADQRADAATDFNDLHQAEALDAVRACLDAAAPVPTVETTLAGADSVPTRAPAAADRLTSVSLIRGDTITPEAVRWLWGGFLAAGKLHVIAGAPGTGKTTLALAFSSTITTGGQWPDSSRSEQGQVLIWSGEDDPADTLVPRLMAAGADMRHVHFVGPAREGSEIVPFDPAHHFPALVEAAKAVGDVSLIIVDPIVSAVAGDGNKNGEVRRGLQPLVDAAGQLGAAVLGISHFSKGTAGRDVVERVTGSVAFGAVARVVLATAKLPDEDGGGRILVRAKSNLGPDGGGFGYELHQIEVPGALGLLASAVKWSDEIAGSARELLAIAESEHENGEGSAAREAEKWLLDLVEDEGGSVDRRRVMDAARAAGFSERTVHRARESLGLTIAQTGFGAQKRSIWRRGEKPIRANSAHSCQPQSLANMGAIGTNANLSDDSEVL